MLRYLLNVLMSPKPRYRYGKSKIYIFSKTGKISSLEVHVRIEEDSGACQILMNQEWKYIDRLFNEKKKLKVQKRFYRDLNYAHQTYLT